MHTLYAVSDKGLGWTLIEVAGQVSELNDIEVRLRPPLRLRVAVVDGDGQPVPSARVRAIPLFQPVGLPAWPGNLKFNHTYFRSHKEVLRIFLTQTDEHGVAVLRALPTQLEERSRFQVIARHERGSARTIVSVKSGERSLELRLQLLVLNKWQFSGRVTDKNGNPIALAEVRAGKRKAGSARTRDTLSSNAAGCVAPLGRFGGQKTVPRRCGREWCKGQDAAEFSLDGKILPDTAFSSTWSRPKASPA